MNADLTGHIKSIFQSRFQSDPILVFSPGRINIIGDHTDYNKGLVLPAAIDKGIYLALGRSDGTHSAVSALDVNDHLDFSVTDTEGLEMGGWKNYILGVVGVLRDKGIAIGDFNLVFSGDLPQGAGLSSSAALENGLVFGLALLFDLGLSREDMIFISQQAEHEYVGVNCGIMDQYANMFGTKGKAILLDCRDMTTKPLDFALKDTKILLVNTKVKHKLAESAYNDRRKVCEHIASLLNVRSLRDCTIEDLKNLGAEIAPDDLQKALFVIEENERALKATEAIKNNDIPALGDLLFRSHYGLHGQYEVSCKELDFLVKIAKDHPQVYGARMMGGGFGGCTINLVKTSGVEEFSKNIMLEYRQEFNMECCIYDVHLSHGTHQIKI
jgi:galactokinase